MKIHEYQARRLLQDCGIPVSRSEVIFEPKEAAPAFRRLANPSCMLKVQVFVGGRGKAGGVRRVKTPEEAGAMASSFIGKPFSTYQSGGKPEKVKSVLIAEDVSIESEYYLGVVMDRSERKPVILFSSEGGVDIEEVSQKNPLALSKLHFSPDRLPTPMEILHAIQRSLLSKDILGPISVLAEKLAKFFIEKDVSLVEINPLAATPGQKLMALDAKILFDDNALFRHEDIRALKDPDEEDERERTAKQFGLSYVSMPGNIGCLVNGAGLAMATMDVIKLAGGEPANFLDVGGGATAEQVKEGFKIILQDERVEAILVNIFGGIMKCDVIAAGIREACREIELQVPLVVRLEGTRVKEGRRLLENSGLKITSCSGIREAAVRCLEEAKHFRAHVHSH